MPYNLGTVQVPNKSKKKQVTKCKMKDVTHNFCSFWDRCPTSVIGFDFILGCWLRKNRPSGCQVMGISIRGLGGGCFIFICIQQLLTSHFFEHLKRWVKKEELRGTFDYFSTLICDSQLATFHSLGKHLNHNKQQMQTAGGEGEKRGGLIWGVARQMVRLCWNRLIGDQDLHSIDSTSTFRPS